MKKPTNDKPISQKKNSLDSVKNIQIELENVKAELSQRERYFNALVERSSDAFALLDAQGNYTYVSASIKKLFGYDQQEFILYRIENFVSPEDMADVGKSFIKLLHEPGNSITDIFRAKNKAGEWRWVESTKTNLLHDPNIQAIVANFRDITDRKKIEEQLLQNQEHTFLAQTAGNIGTYEWNIQTNEIVWGGQIERLYGRKIGSFKNKYENWAETVIPEDLEKIEAQNIECIKTGKDLVSEFRVIHPDKSLHWLLVKAKVFYDEQKNPWKLIGVNVDITERKVAEKQLRYQANILANVSDAVIVTDENFFIKSWNKGAEELYGWCEDEVVGKLTQTILHTRFLSKETTRENVIAIVQKDGVWKGEVIQHTKEGTNVFILVSVTALHDQAGNFLGTVTINRDITEQKRAEELLKHERNQLESEIKRRVRIEKKLEASVKSMNFLADTMPQLVWTAKPNGEYDYFNKRWYEYTALSQQKTKKDGWLSVIHPDDYKRSLEVWERSLKTGEQFEIEYQLKDSDGVYRWFIGRAAPMFDTSGTIIKWFGTCTDIDEQKHVEENIHFLSETSRIVSQSLNYEETLSSIANLLVPKMADWYGVDLVDTDGDIRNVSVAHIDPSKVAFAHLLREKFPIDPEAQTGVPYVVRTGQSEYYPYISDEMLSASAQTPEQLELLRYIGFTSMMIVPLRSRSKIIGALTLVAAESKRQYSLDDLAFAEELANRISASIDNSRLFFEAKRAEKEIKKLNEELEKRVEERTQQLRETNNELKSLNKLLTRSNQELQDLASIASHDLQEPLRKIQTFGERIHVKYGDELNDEAKGYFKRMQDAAARMRILIEDLLLYSRVSSKAQPFDDVNLNSVIKDVLNDLEIRVEETNALIDVDTLPSIKADGTQMRQLFQNLISNALKFHKPGEQPKIKITLENVGKRSKYHRIKVEDNGIGFDKEYSEKIFNIFQRLHSTHEYQGTGIGLAVCRKIVERHKGSIHAESKIGKGATFIIKLPVIQS